MLTVENLGHSEKLKENEKYPVSFYLQNNNHY